MKINLKDILSVTITESKRSAKTVTDRQLDELVKKVKRLDEILCEEHNARFQKQLEAEVDEEFDNTELEIEDESKENERETR